MNSRTLAVAMSLSATLIVSRAASAQVEVTSCGQVVSGSGYLTADLDCTGFTGQAFAVLVSPKGSLDLGGFTIRGEVDGVDCGEVVTDELGETHLYTYGRCEVRNGVITGALVGLVAERLRAVNLRVVDNEKDGIVGTNRGRVLLEDSTISGNGQCGTNTRSVKAVRTTVTDNHYGGFCNERARAVDSTIVGNALTGCTNGACVDIATTRRPRLTDSTCDTNYGRRVGASVVDWDVCALD